MRSPGRKLQLHSTRRAETLSRQITQIHRLHLLRQSKRNAEDAGSETPDLFADFNGLPKDAKSTDFYQQDFTTVILENLKTAGVQQVA